VVAHPTRRRARSASLAGGLAVGLLIAGAAMVTIAVVPESRLGMAAVLSWPGATTAAAALLVAVVVFTSRQWGSALPLLLIALPAVAAATPAAWVYAGAGSLLVWVVTLVAAIRARVSTPVTASNPRQHALVAALAAALWLGGVAAAVAPFALTGDAPHYLTIARSLVVDGDLDLQNDYDERTYADFYPGSLEPRHTNTSPWGEQYPFHGIGISLLVAPAFAWFGVAGATAVVVLIMAAGSALLWLAAWHLLGSSGSAWFGWAALVLSAPFALHAAAIYPDGPAATGVAAALWLAALLHRGAPVPQWALAAGGLGLAALPWLPVRLALPAGVLGLAILWGIWRGQPERWTQVAWFLMVPFISLAAWVGSAQVMFGTWNPSAAILQRTAPGGSADMARGLLGLAADHEYGLLPAAPVMAAALWACGRFVAAFRWIGVATIAVAAGVLGMASFWMWWGGDSAPARFLTVTLPVLALWLAFLWSRSGPGGRRVLSLALGVTAGLTALYAAVDGGARVYTFADGRGSIFEAFSRSVDVALALPSLFRDGESTSRSLLIAATWIGVGAIAAWAVARLPASRGEGTASGIGGLVMLAAAALAAQVGWRESSTVPWTPAAAALAIARDAAPGAWLAAGGDSWRPRAVDELLGQLRLRTPETISIRPPVRLHVPNVPAGLYQIRVEARPTDTGALSVELGREAWPFAGWALADAGPTLTLHAAVHSVRVLGDVPPGTTVWLEPRHIERSSPAGQARRVTRYGPVAVYSMDDNSYPETTGLWTGGNRTTRLLLAAASGAGPIEVQVDAGPAAVAVTLSSPHQERVSLSAGGTHVVRVSPPSALGVVDLAVDVKGGFPATALGNRSDSRTLGVWLAFRPVVAR
jgi:hypothetical protein